LLGGVTVGKRSFVCDTTFCLNKLTTYELPTGSPPIVSEMKAAKLYQF